jgi:hypothetical protein
MASASRHQLRMNVHDLFALCQSRFVLIKRSIEKNLPTARTCLLGNSVRPLMGSFSGQPKPKEATVSKFLAALISAAVVAGSFTPAAEAFPGHRLGFFLGGMAAGALIGHAAEDHRREEAYERMRERQMMAAREQAAMAAAARRERARQIALQQRQAAQLAAAQATPPAPVPVADAPALKKGDRLPSDQDALPTTTNTAQTTTIEKTATETSTPATSETVATTVTCRKYSAAADGLIDGPCQ